MKTNEQLRLTLTGDDGRVRRKCETCGGSGRVNSSMFRSPKHPCDDCDGGWVVNEERVRLAIGRSWIPSSSELRYSFSWYPVAIIADEYRSHQGDSWEWFWNNRHNQPWQASLEAAVDAYIEPAPDYRNDPEALKAALREGGWLYRVEWFRRHEAAAWLLPISDDNNGTGTGDTKAEALFNAVQAAKESGTE